MPGPHLVAAVDHGTSSSRCLLFGRVAATSLLRRGFPLRSRESGAQVMEKAPGHSDRSTCQLAMPHRPFHFHNSATRWTASPEEHFDLLDDRSCIPVRNRRLPGLRPPAHIDERNPTTFSARWREGVRRSLDWTTAVD